MGKALGGGGVFGAGRTSEGLYTKNQTGNGYRNSSST